VDTPVTFPVTLPVTLPVNGPEKDADIKPALNPPEPSLWTKEPFTDVYVAVVHDGAELPFDNNTVLAPPKGNILVEFVPPLYGNVHAVPTMLFAYVAVPDKLPVTLPVNGPENVAVIVPAVKPPSVPSRFTIVLTIFVFVAEFAAFAPLATFAAVTPPTVVTVAEPALFIAKSFDIDLNAGAPLVVPTINWPSVPAVMKLVAPFDV
jgi:hypothetical protein